MATINYDHLSDSDKLDLLRLLFQDLKKRESTWTARDLEQRELIFMETRTVYDRIKRGCH